MNTKNKNNKLIIKKYILYINNNTYIHTYGYFRAPLYEYTASRLG